MINAIAARDREIADVPAPVRLNRCSLYFVPSRKIDSPKTGRMLPIIEPVIDALTTLLRPFRERNYGNDEFRRVPKRGIQ